MFARTRVRRPGLLPKHLKEGSAPALNRILVEFAASSCAAKHSGVAPDRHLALTVAPAARRRTTTSKKGRLIDQCEYISKHACM